MSKLEQVISQLKAADTTIEFQQVIEIIEQYYQYTATSFSNGIGDDLIINKAGENEGSCKLFFFARIQKLNEVQTLNCFGNYYRDDVLKHPERSDHANIRTFIKHGWAGINFDGDALSVR